MEELTFPIVYTSPHLNVPIYLSEERAGHIAERHPDLWPTRKERIAEVLNDPDQIQDDPRAVNKRVFIRKYTYLYTIVVVILEAEYAWLITASRTDRLPKGGVLWMR